MSCMHFKFSAQLWPCIWRILILQGKKYIYSICKMTCWMEKPFWEFWVWSWWFSYWPNRISVTTGYHTPGCWLPSSRSCPAHWSISTFPNWLEWKMWRQTVIISWSKEHGHCNCHRHGTYYCGHLLVWIWTLWGNYSVNYRICVALESSSCDDEIVWPWRCMWSATNGSGHSEKQLHWNYCWWWICGCQLGDVNHFSQNTPIH